MIEVNLIPGGKKRPARGRRPAFAMPKIGGLPQDRWVLGAAAVTILTVGAILYLYMGVQSRREEVDVALAQARQDSARYADLIARTDALMARRDTIVDRISVIQEIDQGRYVWAHIMDEIARALPDYTWVTAVQQVTAGMEPRIRISGQAGNNLALAAFMRALEGSPFLRNVRVQGSQQVQVVEGQNRQLVYAFDLEVSYEQPPMEFLETVPLLGVEPEEVASEDTGR